MESKLEYFKEIYNLIKDAEEESLSMSLEDCHHEGLFSLVIGKTETGHLKRVFIANQKIKPLAIQLHTHKYGVKITAVKGNILHHTASRSEAPTEVVQSILIPEFVYESPLNGGNGLKYLKQTFLMLRDFIMPIGSTLQLRASDIHSVSCSKGSIWIVEEIPCEMEITSSRLFGVPFRQKKSWYKKSHRGTIQQFRSIVFGEVAKLIQLYESINL